MSAANDLLSNYQHLISSLSLVTGGSGVYDVVVNGTALYSKHATGRHADPGEVLELFTELVGPVVLRYGQ